MIKKISQLTTRYSLMSTSPYAFALFTVFFPINKMKSDLWDGQIIQYAIETKDFRGLNSWLGMSGWDLQLLFIKLINLISSHTRLEFYSINHIIIFGCFALLIRQTMFIAKVVLELPNKIVILSGVFLGAMPVWSNLASSVLTIHLVCFALGLYSLELIILGTLNRVIIGFILLLISLQLNSLLMFLPGVYVVYLYRQETKKVSLRFSYYKLAGLLIFAAGYFAGQKKFNPNSGPYLHYNEILNPFNFSNLKIIQGNLFEFSSFLLIPLLALVLNISGVLGSLGLRHASPEARAFRRLIFSILLLMLFSITPYIFVGKSSNIRDYGDWSYRQAFLLAVPLSILVSTLLLSRPIGKIGSRTSSRIYSATISVVLLLSTVALLEVSFATRINRSEFDIELIKTLKNSDIVPEPGTLQITGEGIPGPVIRSYEANYISYKAFGNLAYWTRIGANQDPKFEIPNQLMTLPKSEIIFDKNTSKCETEIRLSIVGYSEPSEVVLNLFGLSENRKIEMDSVKGTCN